MASPAMSKALPEGGQARGKKIPNIIPLVRQVGYVYI